MKQKVKSQSIKEQIVTQVPATRRNASPSSTKDARLCNDVFLYCPTSNGFPKDDV